MSLLSQLRIDIGDFAESGVASSGNLIISHLRVDVGDDGDSGVVIPQVIVNQFATPSASSSGVLSDLRLDVGDDAVNVVSSGITQIAGASGTVVMRHLRVDVGDDTNNLPADVRFIYAPDTATDNAVVRFDGTTGRFVQDSSVLIDDSGNVNIGGATTVGELIICGPQFWGTRVITSSGDVTVNENDNVVFINKIANEITNVVLPLILNPLCSNRILIIKDGKGNASNFPITISSISGTIDGFSSILITQNYQSYTLLKTDTGWTII